MTRRLAIQHVRLHWGKEGRGAKWGTVRHAAPRELPFAPPGDSAAGWLHAVRIDHAAGYRPVEHWHDLAAKDAGQLPIATRIDGDHLWVRLALPTGQPARPHLEGFIARLPLGQRLTVRVNHKADSDHDRWYFEDHLHIGWADAVTLDLPCFREIDERVLLY